MTKGVVGKTLAAWLALVTVGVVVVTVVLAVPPDQWRQRPDQAIEETR